MHEHPDDQDETLDTQVTELAEAALLGALLWDPRRLADVSWLDPTDFIRLAHQAIYRTLTGLARDNIPIDLLALPAVLTRGDYHDLHVDRSGNGPLSAYALSELLTMTPASPSPTKDLPTSGHSEHRRYAAIVLDDSIRRQVLAMGTRLAQITDPPEASTAADLNAALAQVLTHTTIRLDELTRALIESGAESGTASASTPPTVTRHHYPSLIAAQAARAEYTLLGACLTLPRHRELATNRLRPADFSQPDVAASWAALAFLQHHGQPIDFVLLGAQQQRQGAHPEYGSGIDPAQLLALSRLSDPASGWHALALVTATAIARATAEAQQALTEAATDRLRHSDQVLRAARTALHRLEAIRRRLDDQLGPAPTPAAATSRATTAPPHRGPDRSPIHTRSSAPVPRQPIAPHQSSGRTR